MSSSAVIENVDWLVGFDGSEHRLIRGGALAFAGDRITFVGRRYMGQADEVIDGRGHVVIPGLIDLHAHLMFQALAKGFMDDVGSRKLWMTGLYEHYPALGLFATGGLSLHDQLDILRFDLVELVTSGVTTVFDLGAHTEESLQILGDVGLRAVIGPMYRSARWYTLNGHEVLYEWDPDGGRQGFKMALEFIEKHWGDFGGRITGALCPAQVDTCTPGLLKETMEAAERLNVPVQIHAAQTVVEHMEIMRRHGRTPIEFLASCGMIGPSIILGHGMFLAHHSMIGYPDHDDLSLLARTGTHVAHCPWVNARRGLAMESFGGYLRAGVNTGLGTDTCPHDMMQEMRWAAVISKIIARDPALPTAGEVFSSATLGAARALGREDLGRLSPGAKADFVVLNARTMNMRPLLDPIKNIVYYGTNQSVETVFVDGRPVAQGGRVLDMDGGELGERVQRAAEERIATVSERDWAGRSAQDISPLSFPLWEGEE